MSAELITAFANLLWPVIVLIFVFMIRGSISELISAFMDQMKKGADLKIGYFEIKGRDITEFDRNHKESWVYRKTFAESIDEEERNLIYEGSCHLMLAHRCKKTENKNSDELPYYDVSIFIISHKNTGAINLISEVRYYLGNYWGDGEHGEKYHVKNGNDGFALKITAYAPALCVAEIIFHDGQTVKQYRYIDFDEVGFSFDKSKQHLYDRRKP